MEPVLYDVEDGIATITVNRPDKLNSLLPESFDLLAQYADDAQRDDDVQAIIVTGAGERAFSVGGDLATVIPRAAAGENVVVRDPAKRFFSDVFKPVIAAVNGACIAGGLEIMLGTDLRIVSETATFGLAEVRVGVVPAGGSHVRLPRQIPWAIAMQMLLTGEPIDARRAYEVGLVNEVVPAADVLARARKLAASITQCGPVAVRTAKEIAVRAMALEPAFALEHALGERVFRTDDAREGPLAFTEKRPPNFTGR
ncbi:enoyl-CoA hydratase-related protein [Nocardia fluminea]|uniref:enoyl-CoA hydratase/isomerase family protein n=1 Tax=Nocardia fluminea TaxID=134984 RepID=UPI0033F3B3A6